MPLGLWLTVCLSSPQDLKFRRSAECDKPRVVWSVERRAWLSSEQTASLLQQLSLCPLWPCEVGRVGRTGGGGGGGGGGKGGKAKEEESPLSYHAAAYINLSSLLYPGGKGPPQVFPPLEQDWAGGNLMPILKPSSVEGKPETLEKNRSWEATGGIRTHSLPHRSQVL